MIYFLLFSVFMTGTFNQKYYLDKGTRGPYGRILACDSDRDSRNELIFGYYDGIEIYELYPEGVFYLEAVIDTTSNEAWDVGDFDCDGFFDIVLTGDFGLPEVGPQIYESPDSFSYPTNEVWRDTVGPAAVAPIAVHDIDLDGFPEIVKDRAQPYGRFGIYESTGDNQYELIFAEDPDTIGNDAPASTIGFGDFDLDGKIEFVFGGLGGTYWLYESPTNNTYEQILQDYVPTSNIKDCFSVPDADGDGKMEFVVKGFWIVQAQIHAFIVESTSDNTYEIIKSFTFPGGDYHGGYSDAGDVDGDGIPEIVLEARQNVFVIKAAGNDSFYVWDTLPGYEGSSNVRIFDIDNNGLNDVILSGMNETRIYEYVPPAIEQQNENQPYQFQFSIIPNPFVTVSRIELKGFRWNMKHNLTIYNASGRLVKSVKLTTNTYELGADLVRGVYFLKVKVGEHKEIQKLIKIR